MTISSSSSSTALTAVLSWAFFTGICEAGRRTSHLFLSPSEKRKSKDGNRLENVTWPHHVVSQVHALVVTLWSLALIILDNSNSSSADERLFGGSTGAAQLAAFSLGYFAWDVQVCVAHFGSEYGPVFVVHGVMSAVAMASSALGGFCLWFVPRALLFELSTLFLNAHWFMEKTSTGGSALRLANDAIALVSYLGVRVGYGSAVFAGGARDLAKVGVARIGWTRLIGAVVLMAASWSLNALWSFKLLQQAYLLLAPSSITKGQEEGERAPLKVGKSTGSPPVTKRRGSASSLGEVVYPGPARSVLEGHTAR